jgi:transcriptional regulator with XRE-family HTH domain
MTNWVEVLQQFKQERHGSISEIAIATGIPADRLYQWARGRGKPKAEDSRKLEDFFGGSIAASLARKTPEPATTYRAPSAAERIAELQRDKDTLRDGILLSLNSIQGSQDVLLKLAQMGLEQLQEVKALVSRSVDQRAAAGGKK